MNVSLSTHFSLSNPTHVQTRKNIIYLFDVDGKESAPVTECEMKANLGGGGGQPHSENSLSTNGGNIKITENLYSSV